MSDRAAVTWRNVFFLPGQLRACNFPCRRPLGWASGVALGVLAVLVIAASPMADSFLPGSFLEFSTMAAWIIGEGVAGLAGAWIGSHQALRWMNSGRVEELRMTFVPPLRIGQMILARAIIFPVALMAGFGVAMVLAQPMVPVRESLEGVIFFGSVWLGWHTMFYVGAWMSLVAALARVPGGARLWLLMRSALVLGMWMILGGFPVIVALTGPWKAGSFLRGNWLLLLLPVYFSVVKFRYVKSCIALLDDAIEERLEEIITQRR